MRSRRPRGGHWAGGTAWRGPASSFLASSGARRPRRPAIGIAFLLLLLVLVGGAAAVVASATSTTASRPRAATQAGRPGAGASSPARTGNAPAPPSPRTLNAKAIDHVLAYTPFVRIGVPRKRVIALTFDDGPSPYTPAVVRQLVRLRVPATFFIVGQQLRYFSAGLREEIRHGFVIGDHTENHAPLSRLRPSGQYVQIEQDALHLERYGAASPRLFRPPYGTFNGPTMTILRRLHMLMVLWSVDPQDWLRPGARVIVKRVLQAARPGTIVELHDGGGDRSQTVAALPALVAGLRRRHYDLVTVPQLLAADPPTSHQLLPHLSE